MNRHPFIPGIFLKRNYFSAAFTSVNFWWLFMLCLIGTPGFSQQEILNEARQLAINGAHESADLLLSDLVKSDSNPIEARLLRGHNYSWWKKYKTAIDEFSEVLKNDPDNIEALIGKGYAETWSGSSDAVGTFTRVLNIDKGSVEAKKGLAHYFLVSKNARMSDRIYEQLALEDAENPEYLIGRGKALLMLNEKQKARKQFQRALKLDPANTVIQQLIEDTRSEISVLEFDFTTGYSSVGDQGSFGVRLLQATWHFAPKFTVYGRYDNTLSLDNLDLVNHRKAVPQTSLGGMAAWNDKTVTRLELGSRFFPGKPLQSMFRLEQVYFLPESFNLKIGTYGGFSAQEAPEWVAYSSVNIPVSERFVFEPAYFYARDGNSLKPQHRFLMVGKFHHPKGLELSVGGFYGIPNIKGEGLNDNITGGYALVFFPVTNKLWGNISLSLENGVFDRSRVLSFGLKWKLEKTEK